MKSLSESKDQETDACINISIFCLSYPSDTSERKPSTLLSTLCHRAVFRSPSTMRSCLWTVCSHNHLALVSSSTAFPPSVVCFDRVSQAVQESNIIWLWFGLFVLFHNMSLLLMYMLYIARQEKKAFRSNFALSSHNQADIPS